MSDEENVSQQWARLTHIGVGMAERKRDDAAIDVDFYDETARMLTRSRGSVPEIRFVGTGDEPFVVTIPPFLPNHFDGNGPLAPFGDTYWPTWGIAKEFYDRVIRHVGAGKYNETWKG